MDDDQKRFIVLLVLLVFIVLAFLAILFGIVYAMVKVKQVIAPVRAVVRTVRRVKGLKGKAKTVANKVAQGAKKAARSIAQKVRGDLHSLTKQLRSAVPKLKNTLQSKLEKGLALVSGDACAKFDYLWTRHVNLTFYYGILALTSLEPITPEQKQKMDYTASQLLQIQDDLSALMQSCVADNQRPQLTQLLKEHILLVAQMASKWRDAQLKNPAGPLRGFDTDLVAAWYKNADDTTKLLESKTGKRNDNLRNVYKQHLDQTAAYLSEMTKTHASPTKQTFELFAEALGHVPMLASAFCSQMVACKEAK